VSAIQNSDPGTGFRKNWLMKKPLLLLAVGATACAAPAMPLQPTFDLVIENGRVMDPESGLDAARNIGIRDGVIAAISELDLNGHVTIDAANLIVAPGFIDLHSHGQNEENYRIQARDGVTSALEMEVGALDVEGWYSDRAGSALINYGVSVGHIPVRMDVMNDPGAFLPSGAATSRPATEADREAILSRIERGLEQGAAGVGFGLQYTPAASRWEVMEVFRMATRYDAPVHVHIRYMGETEPMNSFTALQEVLAAATITGAPLHIAHIHSSGLTATPRLLQMIAEAQARGVDVSVEAYPYTAGMTAIESAILNEGWQDILGIDYPDLEWAATGERLTEETFAAYRSSGGAVILHFIPEKAMESAVTSPLTIIASDGRLENGRGHPRSAGTYARILGRFVRDANSITWMDAFRKMSLMPAQRLEGRVPAMRNKGRIREGADADLVVIDPGRVIDRATYLEPALPSEGIEFVVLNGVVVVNQGEVVPDIYPGRPLRGQR